MSIHDELKRLNDKCTMGLTVGRVEFSPSQTEVEELRAEMAMLRAEREILRKERDEAREALVEWENAAKHVEANHPDEVHCGCVPVLRKLLTDARRERDEAREALQKVASLAHGDADKTICLINLNAIARIAACARNKEAAK